MKNTLLAAKQQGGNFGETTRDLIGRNDYSSGPGIVSDNVDLATAIGTAANVFTGLAASIAVGTLIWGGIVWSSSAGDEERIARAKNIIKWAIFGLILSLTAWVITETVANIFM